MLRRNASLFLDCILPVFMLLTILACSSVCSANDTKNSAPQPAPLAIADTAVCGHCGMYPARYPQWQAQIVFSDGAMTAFDGCKCLFGFLFGIEQYDAKHKKDDVAMVWVKDFLNSTWLNAKNAYFVVGSDAMGPMGKELIPFGEQMAAAEFQKKHGGSLMAYSEISHSTLQALGMAGHHQPSSKGHGGMQTHDHKKMMEGQNAQ